MQTNNIYEPREPKRVIISSTKSEFAHKNETPKENNNQFINEKGTEISIEYIYKKRSKEDIARKYGINEKLVISCVSSCGGKVSKYLDNAREKAIIENVHPYIPFEKRLGIIVERYENNLSNKEISEKYVLTESNVLSIIIAFSQHSKIIKESKIRTFQRYAETINEKKKNESLNNEEETTLIDKKKEKFFSILNDHKSTGTPFIKLAEKHGVLYQTLMNWKKKYGALEIKKPEYNEPPSRDIKKEDILLIVREKNESNLTFKQLTEKYNIDYHVFLLKKYRYQKNSYQNKTKIKFSTIEKNESNRIKELELEVNRLNKIIDSLVSK